MEDNLRRLYDNVSREFDLPDFDTFKADMQDSTKLRRLYDNIGQSFDLPDYETFVADMGLKKKVPTEFPLPSIENLQKDFQKRQQESGDFSVVPQPDKPKEKRQTSVAGDLLRTLKSTSLRALGGIAAVPNLGDKTIDRLILYPIARAMSPEATDEAIEVGLSAMQMASPGGGQLETLAKYGASAQDKLTKAAVRTDARMKQIEGGIIKNFKEGNTGEAFEQLARGIVGTIPYLAEVAATAGGGAVAVLGTIGATAASQQYGEIKGREDLSGGKKILNSWLYGGFEAAGELVTAGILNRTFRALRGAGMQPTKEVTENLAKSLLKKFGIIGKEGSEEAASEMITQVGQNLTAIWTGEDTERKWHDGVLDAGLIGFFPGAGMGTIQAAVAGRAIATKEEVDAVNESHAKQAAIIEQIEAAENTETKEVLEQELIAEKDNEQSVIEANIEVAKTMTEEQLAEVSKLQTARAELDAKISDPALPKEERANIESISKGIDEQIIEIREATPKVDNGASDIAPISKGKTESGTQVSPEGDMPTPTSYIEPAEVKNEGVEYATPDGKFYSNLSTSEIDEERRRLLGETAPGMGADKAIVKDALKRIRELKQAVQSAPSPAPQTREEVSETTNVGEGVGVTKTGETVAKSVTKTESDINIELNKESSHKKEEGFSYDINWYDIKNQQGDIVGNIVLLDRGDYYQVQNAKVETPRKGIGLAAYKQLITQLDKPLYSDTSMTQPAHGLWNKLVAEGLAEQFKENIGSEKKPNIISRYRTIAETAKIAPQKENLPEKSTFNFDTEEMVIGKDLVDDIKAVEDAARTMSAREFGDYWLTAINKIWEEGGRKTTERSRAFEAYFKSILPEDELLAGTPIREAILGTIGKRQIIKTNNILVKALNGEVVDKIDDKGRAILEGLVSFTEKKYPGKKLGVSIGAQPISVAGSDGFRMTIPNVDSPIGDMFPYDAKLVIPAYEELERRGADRRTLWAAHDWFHEMAHTEGIENEKEADAFAVKHVQEFIASRAETAQVESRPTHPLTEKEFNKKYKAQHKNIRSKTPEEQEATLRKIQEEGFKSEYINALPISRGGKPQTIVDRNYGNKKGDVVYLVPKEWVRDTPNGYKVKNGWKPESGDVVTIEYDGQPTYEAYLNAQRKNIATPQENKATPLKVEEENKAIPLNSKRLKESDFSGLNNRPLNKLDQDNRSAISYLNNYPSHFIGVTEIVGEGAEKITGITPKGAAQISKVSEYALELNFLNPSTKESSSQVMHFNTQEALDAAVDKIYEFTGRAVQKPEDFTGRERERMAEIEKIVAAEGFRFDVEPDSDPAMSSIDIYRANLNIGYDELPQGIKDLADEYTHLIHSAGLRTDYETPLIDVDAPPPAEPTVVEQTEQPEGKERTILRRVIDASNVPQEVKDELIAQGIEYIPRGRRFTHAEAQELISVFGSTEGGIDRLFATVKDMSNGILPDTRTVLNVYVAEQYSKQLDSATDIKTREQLRKKVADAYMVGAELATMHGQAVEAQKKWQEILARDPEVIIVTKKRRQSENNKDALKAMEGDVKASEEFLTENIANSDEFKKILEERVSEEIDKIANKKYGKVDKKKIDDFFDSLLIKTDKAFDATLGIPIAVYNGAVLVIKKAVLTGVDISNAVAQGVEYINAWYKEKYDKGEIPSPDWNKDDYAAVMPERLKPLTKTVKKVRYKLPKKAEDTIVDKLYDKMATATKPQLRRLVREYVATLEEEGAVSSDRFKDLFAKAIGLEVLSVQDEQTIRLAGQSINYARKKADTLMDAFNDYLKEAEQETPDKARLAEIEADIKKKKKDANKARFAAQKAAQQLDKLLQEELELGQTLSTLIQGNLLTPISLMSNVIGNTTFLPVRGAARMVASALDNMVYGLAKAYTPLVKKIDPQKHPRLARLANGLPTPMRIYRNFASLRGFAIGFKRGAIEGALQLYTGQLSEDIYRREASRGLEPVKAAMRFYNQLTGKEQARFDKLLSDFLEAMPAGYFAEGFFRALNLGDKPFRRAAETGRLYEIAQMKGLRGKAKEAFLSNPDADTLEEMRKAGELSVYQQDNIVSDLMKYLSQKLNKVNASKEHKRRSIVAKTLGSLAKATTMPFVKTPTNLIAEAFEYAIPVVTAARGVYAMKNGDRRKATDLFGKAIVGQMFVSLAVYLLKSGLLTPPPDDDDKIRQAQYEGKRGYSFNPDAAYRAMTGGDPTWQDKDRVWSYQRLGVPSMMLMGVAKAYSDVPQDKVTDLSYLERSIAMLPGIASGALDQSFLTGVSTALTAWIEGEAKFNDWFINTTKALSAAVYPNTVAQISQTFFSDNYIREVRDMYSEDERLRRRMVNTFKDRLFMSKDLPTKVTIWGEDVKRIPEGRSWPYMFFDVTKETKYQRTTFGVKMYEMYERYRLVDEEEAKNIIPSLPSATVEVGWDKRNMTAMEVNELQKKVGTLRRMYVERLMSSEEWMDMTDEERITELQSIYRDASSKVKSEMFMLDIVKASDKWEFLRTNDFIPVPTSSITINGKRIAGEEAANFYDQVQRLFVLELGGMPDGKVSDDMREDYKKDVEKAWARAKRDITNEWRDKIPEPEE